MARRLAAIAAVVACATAGVAPPEALASAPDASLLAAPPAHARPGVCYAHVRREARYAPPPGPRNRWRLSPPPPGAPGPVWCLVTEADTSPPVLLQAEREGWIRVLCADDATPARIAGLQRRLHAYGDYAGPIHGRYDAATGAGLKRFQAAHGLNEGGYMGLRTVEAIERDEGVQADARMAAYVPPPPPPVVILPPPNPADTYGLPGRWLSWPGKSGY